MDSDFLVQLPALFLFSLLFIHLSIYPSSIYPLCSYSYALGFPERAQQLVVPVEENSVAAHRSPPELRPTAVPLPSRLIIPEQLVASPRGFTPGPPGPSVSIFLLNLWATARDLQSDWSL